MTDDPRARVMSGAALETKAAAESWLRDLIAAGLSIHLEDDPDEFVPDLWDEDEAEIIRARVAECYRFDWAPPVGNCPIGYMLDIETPGWRTA